jgi:hypothetical protein
MTLALDHPAPADPTMFFITVQQYHQMIEHGILTEEHPVELIEGVLVKRMPKKRRHVAVCAAIRAAMEKQLPEGFHFQGQEPVTLATSEPEPDGAIVRGKARDYANHPTANDVAVVFEVADSSLQFDRATKGPMYAAAGIATYVLVNLADDVVEVYTRSTADAPAYDAPRLLRSGDVLELFEPAVRIPVAAMLEP